MAKNNNSQPKNRIAGTQVSDPAPGETPENLDKVRDILFGGQMRTVDARLRGLEDRLLHEHQALKTEFTRHLTELDGSTKKEFQALGEKLAAERTKRVEDLKTISAELKDALKSLEKRHLRLEEASGMADAELRDHLLKQATALSTDITRVSDRISGELDRSVKQLDASKLDTTSLIGLLTDLTSRLGGNGKGPSKNPSKG